MIESSRGGNGSDKQKDRQGCRHDTPEADLTPKDALRLHAKSGAAMAQRRLLADNWISASSLLEALRRLRLGRIMNRGSGESFHRKNLG
jgi:hypothetical protein